MIAKTIFKTVLDFVMPPACSFCRLFLKERTVFCDSCRRHIAPVVTRTLTITATKKIKVFAVSDYKEPIRPLILSKKRSDIVSARQLGELIWHMTYIKNMEFDYIVPVPLHWTRFAKRGFNQAEEMAKVLSKKSGVPVVRLLKRVKRTEYQAGLSQDLRTENVKKAFELCSKNFVKYKGKRFLLVDDLMTTGSTLTFCSRVLYQLKPGSIMCAVACRVV